MKNKQNLDWEDQLKILINDWVFRLIKFGTIDLPKNRQGFMAFECPELADFIRANFIPKKDLKEVICTKCNVEMYLKFRLDEGRSVYQCPNCKNIDAIID